MVGEDSVGGSKLPLKERLRAWWHGHEPQWADSADAADPGVEEGAGASIEGAPQETIQSAPALDPGEPQKQVIRLSETVRKMLWGDGFAYPGGADQVLRLVKPLMLTGEQNYLEVSRDPGGPGCAVHREFGTWVEGIVPSPELAKAAHALARVDSLEDKVQVKAADFEALELPNDRYDGAFAKEALLGVENKAALLDAIAESIKSGGMLSLIDFVIGADAPAEDSVLAAWVDECAGGVRPWTAAELDETVVNLGLQVRTSEDVTPAYLDAALTAWTGIATSGDLLKIAPEDAGGLLDEGRIWNLYQEVFRSGTLRVHRVFATKI
jgi:hypothetical protein